MTTIVYPAGGTIPPSTSASAPALGGARAGRVVVTEERALAAAWRLEAGGLRPVVLNFASARNPGGGYRAGARGHEEDLCRATRLAQYLEAAETAAFYEAGRAAGPLNTDWALYTPAVPVLLTPPPPASVAWVPPPPWLCAFITCAAPNATQARLQGHTEAELERAFQARVPRVFAIAAAHAHRSLVLGAWGCGSHGNNPHVVARVFAASLRSATGTAAGLAADFEEVVFAIPDSELRRPFARQLAGRIEGVP